MEEKLPSEPCSDVTAVVLSGGSSNNFFQLTKNTPKALLKVCGKSLLWHNLVNLINSEFKVLTNEDIQEIIRQEVDLCLKTLSEDKKIPKVLVHIITSSEDGTLGTTDAINCLENLINNDFIIIPCDLYGSFDFKTFLKFHKKVPRLCTVALFDLKSFSENTKNKSKKELCLGGNEFEEWSFKYKVVVTMDENTNSILGVTPLISIDSGEDHEIYKWHLLSHPRCYINQNFVDIHIYAFSKDIFKLFKSELFKNTSIRLDFVPYIIRNQEIPFFRKWITMGILRGSYEEFKKNKEWKPEILDNKDEESDTNTYYFLAYGDHYKCCRVNSIDTLYSINVQSCFWYKDKSGKKNIKLKNIILGENVKITETCEIKNSVIGNNVCIGNNVKITDSVVMDNCVIKDGVLLCKSVLGVGVIVEESSNLKNAVVRSETQVPSNTSVEKDFLPSFIES